MLEGRTGGASSTDYQPPGALADFLAAGPPPLYVPRALGASRSFLRDFCCGSSRFSSVSALLAERQTGRSPGRLLLIRRDCRVSKN